MTLSSNKLNRVRQLLEQQGLDAAVFTSTANFAWLTGGDSHVGLASDTGPSAALVTRDRVVVLCDNIEAPRIAAEETGDLGVEMCIYPWWEGLSEERIRDIAGSDRWLADIPMTGRPAIEALMYPLRAALDDSEVETYRELGLVTGLALEEAAQSVEIGQSEHEVAAELARGLLKRGATPTVLLIAADERISRFRHPIPTSKRVERMCMLVAGARMKGLICSATRIVHFGKLPQALEEKHRAVCTVDAALLAHTVPGETAGDAMKAGIAAYTAAGYPDEWTLHHQGGPTGYRPREFRATAESIQVIAPEQAFAWNPSITGTKSEDTVLAREPAPLVLTVSMEWPVISAGPPGARFERPDILVK
jgi:Xaa-Pro aminopeptidase